MPTVTIAACYVSQEGVVLGADSTSTYGTALAPHYYNYSQKLFEIGENSTLGVVCWGLGGLQVISHRTQFALLADSIAAAKPNTVQKVAEMWTDQFWAVYTDPNSGISSELDLCKALAAKSAHDAASPADAAKRTEIEEKQFNALRTGLVSGFCIAGYMPPDRTPSAYQIIFDPLGPKPTPMHRPYGYWFWGAPNMIQRLIFGLDDGLKASIMASGKWSGSLKDLEDISAQHTLAHPIIPIRDAIDFVHSFIFSTIKAFKFSTHSQICGGPIETAVITTDRKFRWVRHKELDAAVAEGER